MKRASVLVTFLVLSAMPVQTAALNVYWIGNSLTDGVQYERFVRLVQSRSQTCTWGRNIILGAPLYVLYNNTATLTRDPYGEYRTALASNTYHWDAISLQAGGQRLIDPDFPHEGDSMYVTRFVEYARPKNPSAVFYLYETWVGRPGQNDAAVWSNAWLAPYTNISWYDNNGSRSYFWKLIGMARRANPSATINMVPVGDVLYELNERMRAGSIPGFTSVYQFYADDIHLNKYGEYATSCTFYAVLYKTSPVGLGFAEWGVESAMAAQIQDAAWDVVSAHPYTGVAPVAVGATPTAPRASRQMQTNVQAGFNLLGRTSQTAPDAISVLVGARALQVGVARAAQGGITR